MILTPSLLRAATGCTAEAAALYAVPLGEACAHYGINTPARLAAFLAQLSHESGDLRHVRELASGHAYEGRANLGNTLPGDGPRFKGRGLIQVTGRANYRRAFERLRRVLGDDVPDFEVFPEALEEPQWACWSAADYWDGAGLNALADAGEFDDISSLINTGRRGRVANGAEDRRRRHQIARAAIGAEAVQIDAGATIESPPVPAEPPAEPIASAPSWRMPAGEAAEWEPGPAPEGAWPFPAENRIDPPSAAPPTPQPEANMAPFGATLIGGLANSLVSLMQPLLQDKLSSELARHGDPAVAEKIAAQMVETAKRLTSKPDPIEAVAAVRAMPQAVKALEADVTEDLRRMGPLLDKMHEWDRQAWAASEESRAAARHQNDGEPFMVDTPWVKLKFIHLLSIAFVSFSAWFVTMNWGGLTSELKGAVITLMIIAGWSGVRDYWMGSSRSSAAKDAVLGELSRRPRS